MLEDIDDINLKGELDMSGILTFAYNKKKVCSLTSAE